MPLARWPYRKPRSMPHRASLCYDRLWANLTVFVESLNYHISPLIEAGSKIQAGSLIQAGGLTAFVPVEARSQIQARSPLEAGSNVEYHRTNGIGTQDCGAYRYVIMASES